MEEMKVQLVFEFDRSEYDAFLFLMDQKKDEEAEQIWEAMSKAPEDETPDGRHPIKCDYNAFEGEAKTVKLMMMCAAIASVKELVKGK